MPGYVIYQTLETVFHPISKHREVENTTRSGLFLTKFDGVWKSDETPSRVFDVSLNRNKNYGCKQRN